MYLVFFKVNINEVYLNQAIESQDISAIQQNANALNESAKEGLEVLKSVVLYKDDKSLVNATKIMFNFFIDETENSVPQIVDFLILEEDFKSIQVILEKTPQRKRKKKQVDNYNKKVKEINKSVKNYNKMNTQLNTNRQKVFETLNNTNNKFLERHIPKD